MQTPARLRRLLEMTKKNKEAAAPLPYSPKPEERAAIEKAFKERKIAPAPRLKVDKNNISIDHPDNLTGHLLMQNALGTLDSAFMLGLLKQLGGATSRGSTVDEGDLNFMVSFIKGIEPRDQVEATLAAHMAVVNMAIMRFARLLPLQETLLQLDATERALNKFARTFTAQMEALKRYRSGGEQNVTVHHVSVKEGGQAIVGNITQNSGQTTAGKAASPPALTHSKVAPMEPVSEAPRETTPVKRKSTK